MWNLFPMLNIFYCYQGIFETCRKKTREIVWLSIYTEGTNGVVIEKLTQQIPTYGESAAIQFHYTRLSLWYVSDWVWLNILQGSMTPGHWAGINSFQPWRVPPPRREREGRRFWSVTIGSIHSNHLEIWVYPLVLNKSFFTFVRSSCSVGMEGNSILGGISTGSIVRLNANPFQNIKHQCRKMFGHTINDA